MVQKARDSKPLPKVFKYAKDNIKQKFIFGFLRFKPKYIFSSNFHVINEKTNIKISKKQKNLIQHYKNYKMCVFKHLVTGISKT